MPRTDDRIAKLAETVLAEELSPDDLDRLAAAGSVREVGAGEVLLEKGRRRGALVVVLEGEVDVLQGDEDEPVSAAGEGGGPGCLVTLAERSVVGEIGLLLDSPPTATVRARTACCVFVLERSELERLIARGGEAATHLALALGKVVAVRLRRMNQEVAELCSRYEEALAEAAETKGRKRVAELEKFRRKLLQEWSF